MPKESTCFCLHLSFDIFWVRSGLVPLVRFILSIWKEISSTACLLPSLWWSCPYWETRWEGRQGSQFLLGNLPRSTNVTHWREQSSTFLKRPALDGICGTVESTWRQGLIQVKFQPPVVYLFATPRGRLREALLKVSLLFIGPLFPCDAPRGL